MPLPDWTDDEAYPKKLPNEGWAWEFLRRNAKYREDWIEFCRVQAKLSASPGSKSAKSSASDEFKVVYGLEHQLGIADDEFEAWVPQRSHGSRDTDQGPWVTKKARAWGLYSMADPELTFDEAQPKFFRNTLRSWRSVDAIYKVERKYFPDALPEPDRYLYVEFDMRKSLKTQIKEARELLGRTQKSLKDAGKVGKTKSGGKFDRYGSFLRIFDAYQAKPKPKNVLIAERVLKNHSDIGNLDRAVSEIKARAEELVQGDYRSLLP